MVDKVDIYNVKVAEALNICFLYSVTTLNLLQGQKKFSVTRFFLEFSFIFTDRLLFIF